MNALYEEVVANGMRVLDLHVPDWVDRINLDRLNIACTENCVCGQVFVNHGSRFECSGFGYATGQTAPLGVEVKQDCSQFGFGMGILTGDSFILTQVWKQAITERREQNDLARREQGRSYSLAAGSRS